MDAVDVIEIVNEIENVFDVNEWQVDSIHIWPLLRIKLAYKLYERSNINNNCIIPASPNRYKAKVNTYISNTYNYWHATLMDMQNNEHIVNRDLIFLSDTKSRMFSINDKMYNIFCDPLAEIAIQHGLTCFNVEYSSGSVYRIPRYSKSLFIQRHLDKFYITSVLLKTKVQFVECNSYRAFISYIATRFPDCLESINFAVHNQISYIQKLAGYYMNILQKVKPKLGFVVCYYACEGMAFNLACRSLGIPVVDIQHGVAGDVHPAYGRWSNVPNNGYDLLPSTFWCWDESDAKAIDLWNTNCSKRHKAEIGGNIVAELFKCDSNNIVKHYDNLVLDVKQKYPSDLNILLTLQAGYGFPNEFKEAISNSPDSWLWYIRLHPSMMAEMDNIRALGFKKNVILKEASIYPLHSLLRHVDVHVTGHSATVYDARSFGVPSIIGNPLGESFFKDLITEGYAWSARTGQEIINVIQDNKQKIKLQNKMDPIKHDVPRTLLQLIKESAA